MKISVIKKGAKFVPNFALVKKHIIVSNEIQIHNKCIHMYKKSLLCHL